LGGAANPLLAPPNPWSGSRQPRDPDTWGTGPWWRNGTRFVRTVQRCESRRKGRGAIRCGVNECKGDLSPAEPAL